MFLLSYTLWIFVINVPAHLFIFYVAIRRQRRADREEGEKPDLESFARTFIRLEGYWLVVSFAIALLHPFHE